MPGKQTIAEYVHQETGFPIGHSEAILTTAIEFIIEAVLEKKTVELRGFGYFHLKKRRAIKYRHFKTGEQRVSPERYQFHFTPFEVVRSRAEQVPAGDTIERPSAHKKKRPKLA